MPVLTAAFDFFGRPMIDVYVSMARRQVEANREAGLQVPPPVALTALLDTDSARTIMDTRIAEVMDLDRIGDSDVYTVS